VQLIQPTQFFEYFPAVELAQRVPGAHPGEIETSRRSLCPLKTAKAKGQRAEQAGSFV